MTSFPLTRSLVDNEFVRGATASTLPVSLGRTLGAAFDQPFTTGLLKKQSEITRAGRGKPAGVRLGTGELVPGPQLPQGQDPMRPFSLEFEEFRGRVFSAQVLNERYGHLGLHFEHEMSAEAAELMANSKRAEIIRNNIIARGPGGVGPFVAQLGAALLKAAIDPIEVASVFVPIVSQARAAGFIARFGTTRGRALVGAVEGVGGNLLLEPAFGGLSRQLQLDYGMADALVNVMLGGLLGAGIGGGIGAGRALRARNKRAVVFLDTLELTPSQRADFLELTPGQRTDKGQVDIDITTRKVEVKQLSKEIKLATRELDALRKRGVSEGDDSRTTLAVERTDLEARKAIVSKELRALQEQKKGTVTAAEEVAVELDKAVTASADLDPKVSGDAFKAAVAQAAQGKSVDVSGILDPTKRALLKEIEEKAVEVKRLQSAEAAALKETQGLPQDTPERQVASEKRAEIAKERLALQREAGVLKKQAKELDTEIAAAVAKAEQAPSRDGLHEANLVREADTILAAKERVPDESIAELQGEVDRMKEAGEISEADLTVIDRAFKSLDERSAAMPKIIDALKICLTRT